MKLPFVFQPQDIQITEPQIMDDAKCSKMKKPKNGYEGM